MQQTKRVRPRCASYVHLFTLWHCLSENSLNRSGSHSSRRTRSLHVFLQPQSTLSFSVPFLCLFYLFFFDHYILSLIPPSLCWFVCVCVCVCVCVYLIPMLYHRVSSRVETILHSRRLQFRKGGRHESNTYNLSLQALVSESHSVVSDSLRSHGLWPPRLLCPWEFSWKAY